MVRSILYHMVHVTLLEGELVQIKLRAGITWLDFVLLEHDFIIRTPVPFITFVFFGSESFA